ncbi:MAG: tyrosine-type recombinase/integrase [Halanaeroarchaeum sp.]
MHGLDPLSPSEGVKMYLDERRPEVTKSTLHEHSTRLNRFTEWCEKEGVDNLNALTRRKVQEYKNWRQKDVAPTTLTNEIRTLRLAIEFWESIDGVAEGVARNVNVPTTPKREQSRDVKLDPDHAEAIMEYLGKYEYATLRHTMFAIVWHTGCRTSGLRALDLGDYNPDEYRKPVLEFRHRPDSGTPLKKERWGEREVPIKPEIKEIIEDYIKTNRKDVTDEFGREPLLTTREGRVYKTTVQRNIYRLTQPCYIGTECPEGKDPETCEFTKYNKSSQCPVSVSPHSVRKGNVTHLRDLGISFEDMSDRVDATPEVLRQHYDVPTPDERRERQFDLVDEM